MFTITVQTEFCAAHTISIAGNPEPVHGHNWRVTAAVEAETLDEDGFVCDFHTVEDTLHEIITPFINNDLNATPPFDTLNPTAEHIAKHIADELAAHLDEPLAPHARVAWVSITEAPGCVATYRR
ncbi:MAG: 6-carboxytetrahydropterin synthase [Phycisphaerales bacterium]|nr:6-carboxytetrahydropterin synthase [Phycisphaerales bacterium]